MNTQDIKVPQVLIISCAFVLASLIFGTFYYSAQKVSKDTLSVTGSAKTTVTSDQAKLILVIEHAAPASDLSSGYSAVARDLGFTKTLLMKEGLPETAINESTVSTNQIYEQKTGGEQRYSLRQTLTIQLDDVNKLTDISKKIPDLSKQGAVVSIQSLEYYYSKLPDLRVSLLQNAVKDAKARADQIAKGTGRNIGSVRTASSGVVQVLSPNSVDISDYGTYDTSSIQKDIMVTVKASFELK
jgi:hypothetical protein